MRTKLFIPLDFTIRGQSATPAARYIEINTWLHENVVDHFTVFREKTGKGIFVEFLGLDQEDDIIVFKLKFGAISDN